MNRRLLAIFLAAVFAAQSLGVAGALHLAFEHASCLACGPESAHHHGAEGGPDTLAPTDCGPQHSAHDPAHCPICQVLAAAKPLAPAGPAPLQRSAPVSIEAPAARTLRPHHWPISTLGPRAPPTWPLPASV